MKSKGRRIVIMAGLLAVAIVGFATWLCWPHLRFWSLSEPLGSNPQGYREYRHRQTGIVFVRLPGGKFWMGAQRTDPNGQNYDPEAVPNEAPVHEVTLSPFLMGKHEVTQAEWRRLMESNQSHYWGPEDQPMAMVTWGDVKVFDSKNGFRLPTEAQWEYACRAGTTTPIAGTGKLDDMGWYDKNSGRTAHPVGQKATNKFGLSDMHGNVWEWCEDVYDDNFYGKAESAKIDPVSNDGSEVRVFRGGAWRGFAQHCRSAYRSGANPRSFCDNFLGFRAAYYPVP